MEKSREERAEKFRDLERRAEINTRKLEEKERKRAEERELEQSGEDDASDESSDFIVSDEDPEDRTDAMDEPEAAGEMSRNILETGAALLAIILHFAFFFRIVRLHLMSFYFRHTALCLPVLQGQRAGGCVRCHGQVRFPSSN